MRLERHGAGFVLDLGDGENRLDAELLAGFGAALDEVERSDGPRALVTIPRWRGALIRAFDAFPSLMIRVLPLMLKDAERPIAVAVRVARRRGNAFETGDMRDRLTSDLFESAADVQRTVEHLHPGDDVIRRLAVSEHRCPGTAAPPGQGGIALRGASEPVRASDP